MFSTSFMLVVLGVQASGFVAAALSAACGIVACLLAGRHTRPARVAPVEADDRRWPWVAVAGLSGFGTLALDEKGQPRFPIVLTWDLFAGATLLATTVGLLSAFLPARRASRMDPATAIRNG